jgi:SSS family solute:Na+ symporter
MNMHWIDWTIIAVFLTCLIGTAVFAGSLSRSVTGFLAANRCAGRYLLSISQGIAGLGAIGVVANFELFYNGGFSAGWWQMTIWPVWLFVSVSGWVAYRYRETRAMTMAQFFEIRYSRRFRVFCGVVAWAAGVVNLGIFPAVSARFFIHFCGLPPTYSLLGFEASTFASFMLAELSIAMLLTMWGGMIVLLVTDFLQGMFSYAAFLIIMGVLFLKFRWSDVVAALQTAPENESLLNPFKMGMANDFNPTYFMIVAVGAVYGWKAWQGQQGFNAAPKNAHEAKMAGIISIWRELILMLLLLMVPIYAYTLLHGAPYELEAQRVEQAIAAIDQVQIQKQLTVPLALAEMLPAGFFGLFVAVMLAASISTNDTCLHSWGSIFIQDVVLPFREKGFTPTQHLWMLRASVFIVALIVFCISLFFRQNDHIIMYLMLAGAIYLGGAGAAIIGGLYWKHGTTGGAWGAMIVGGLLACGGLIVQAIWTQIVPTLMQWFPDSIFLIQHPDKFPYDGVRINFFAILCAICTYISISLWSRFVLRTPAFNLDKMLHRGPYAIAGEHEDGVTMPDTGWRALLPGKEFSGVDKLLHLSLTAWILGWSVFYVGVNFYHFTWGTTDEWWASFWPFYIWLNLVLGAIATTWFLIGGVFDLRYMIHVLRNPRRDPTDDGRVPEHSSEPEYRETVDRGSIIEMPVAAP